MNKKILVIAGCGALMFGIIIGIAMWLIPKITSPALYTGPVEKIRIGVELGLVTAPVWVAEHNGYFQAEGLDVEIKEFDSGTAALRSMLKEGNLDMTTMAQTPFVFNSFDRNDYGIIASMVSSPNDMKILARKDSGINMPSDLRGKKVGVTKGSTAHYFLSLFLAQRSLGLTDVTIVDFEASTLAEALSRGQVDAIASWEPYIYNAKKLIGNNALVLESNGTFREDFYFSVFKDWAKNNPKRLKRFLRAIDKAETFIIEHPTESQSIVAKRLKLDPLFVTSVWSDYSFGLFLDQAILLTFEQQARWMITNKLTDKTMSPNYLDFIYFNALEAVKPEAVTIIR